MKTGKATAVCVRLDREHALNFGVQPGGHFIDWMLDDDGDLTIMSGTHREIFPCGTFASIGIDDYQLQKVLH